MDHAALQAVLRDLRRFAASQGTTALTDAQVLRRFVDTGDEAAFEVLVWRHGPMVLGCCRKYLGHDHDAEDAFQATFLVLARKAGSIARSTSLAGWLHRVAYRVALRLHAQVRRRRARERAGSDLSAAAAPSTDLARVEDRDLWAVVARELDRLPARYRLPLVACYLQGKTHAEAARELGRPFGSMSGDLARGCALLQQRLTRHGAGLSAVALTALLADQARATVSVALVVPTVTASLKFSAGTAVPGPAAGLAHGVVQSMLVSKLMVAAAAALVVTTLGVGTVGLARQAVTPAAPPTKPTELVVGGRGAAQAQAPRLDPLGDSLPEFARMRLGTARLRHGGPVVAVAFTPDGKTAITGGSNSDGNIRLWDAAIGREVRTIPGAGAAITAIAVTPDGKTILATAGDKTIRLWDVATGAEVRRLRGHQAQPTSVAVTPDGRAAVSSSVDKTARVWDLSTGQELRVFADHRAPVQSVAIAADGTTVASAGADNMVRLWDLATGREQRVLNHATAVYAVAFAPDGKRLASVDQSGAVKVWDPATGQELTALRTDTPSVHGLAFSPDGLALAGGGQRGPVRVWNLATGQPLRVFAGPPAAVWSLAFSGDGRTLLVGSDDRHARLLDVATGRDRLTWPGHAGAVNSVAATGDGKSIVTCSADGAIVWDLAAGKVQNRFTAPHQNAKSTAFSPGAAEMAAAGQTGIVRVYDRATGRLVRQLGNHGSGVTALTWSGDGRTVASAGNDGSIQLWDAAAPGKPRAVVKNAAGSSRVLALTHAGAFIASAQPQQGAQEPVRVWNAATGFELYQLTGHHAEVVDLAFSPDARTLATAARDGDVCLWDMTNGQLVGRLEGHGMPAWAVAFSPDGRTIATGMEYTVRLWDTATRKELARFLGHHGLVQTLAFMDDGRTLVSGCTDGTALVWDATARPAVVAKPADGRIPVDLKTFRFNVPEELQRQFGYQGRFDRLYFYNNGRGEVAVEVPADGEYEIIVRAACDSALNERARFKVAIDGEPVGRETLLTADDETDYTLTATLKAGARKLAIEFTNDIHKQNEYDRNLYIYGLALRPKK
jgi:RNA polymerase sigma factor (sigma-70 family)